MEVEFTVSVCEESLFVGKGLKFCSIFVTQHLCYVLIQSDFMVKNNKLMKLGAY